jgi:hypothetical protein
VGDESWPNNTEIEVNDENVHISGKFGSNNSLSGRAENQLRDDDPNNDDDALNNKCRNGSSKKGIFRDPPELEMPAVDKRPEDER